MENKEVLTTKEVAALLKIRASTVQVLVRHGKIPGNRIGKRWRFIKADVLGILSTTEEDMGLYIEFKNISGLKPVSNYRVRVRVNEKQIAGDFIIKGHKREDGWFTLVKKFVETYEIENLVKQFSEAPYYGDKTTKNR